MKSSKSETVAFGTRLRAAMLRRGHGSRSARSGVDVAALAAAASTSYEMARRYAEGVAIPRPDKLRAIAGWLGVAPGLLAWGDQNSAAINQGLLGQCIQLAIEAQGRTVIALPAERVAHIAALLYREAEAAGMPSPESVDLMILAAGGAAPE